MLRAIVRKLVRLSVVASCCLCVPSVKAQPTETTFDWPSPGRVEVSEFVFTDGHTLEFSYALEFEKGQDHLFRIRYVDFELRTVDGVDFRDTEWSEAAETLLAAFRALPALQVSGAGVFEGTVGLDGYVQTLVEHVENTVLRDRLLETALTRFGSEIETELRLPWSVWVELWSAQSLPVAGESIPAALMPGTITNLGPVEGAVGQSRLTFESDELDLTPNVGRLLILLANELQANEAPTEVLERGSLTLRAWVETDLTTLRPVTAFSEERREVILEGDTLERHLETHEYSFRWCQRRDTAWECASNAVVDQELCQRAVEHMRRCMERYCATADDSDPICEALEEPSSVNRCVGELRAGALEILEADCDHMFGVE